jgi:hypothetical protein
VDLICAAAWRALRLTAILLGVAPFAALGGTAETASFTAAQGDAGQRLQRSARRGRGR